MERRNGTYRGLAYDRVGSGPPLVLLHGGSGRRQWFDGLVPLLVDRVEMLLVDLPGHGDSADTPGRYRLQDTAAVVAELLDHLGCGPSGVFGHSHGGHVALVLAADRPDLVSVLVDGDAPLDRERLRISLRATEEMRRSWEFLAASGMGPAALRRALPEVEITDPATGRRTTVAAAVGGPDHPYVREMATSLAAHDPDFLAAVGDRFDETFARLDAPELLATLRCPLVLLQADPAMGGLLTDADLDLARSLAPHVVSRRIVGVGHGLQFQDPEKVAAVLREIVLPLLESARVAIARARGRGRGRGGGGVGVGVGVQPPPGSAPASSTRRVASSSP